MSKYFFSTENGGTYAKHLSRLLKNAHFSARRETINECLFFVCLQRVKLCSHFVNHICILKKIIQITKLQLLKYFPLISELKYSEFFYIF